MVDAMPSPQIPPGTPAGKQRLPAALAVVTALAAFAALHWTGTGMINDSWAYWEGAVSLATGHGYTYFSGSRIEAWPPLYSAYLALWVLAAGPQGWVLTVAMGLLIGLQAALWLRLLRIMATDSGLEARPAAWLLAALFVGLFLAAHQRYPFAQNLLYVILPLFLEATRRIVVRGESRGPHVVALGLLLPLTHTTGIAFLGAGAALIGLAGLRSPRRLGLAVLVVVLPAAAWVGMRVLLGQAGSHCIGWGVGRYGALEYAVQLFTGPGRLIVPDRFGTAIAAVAALWIAALVLSVGKAGITPVRFVAAFCALSAGILYALFNLSWVYVPIGGRFVLFLPLLLVPVAGLTLAARAPRLGAGLLALLLLPQFYWLGVWTLDQGTSAELFARQPTAFMPHDGYATRAHRTGPPLRQGDRLLIAPDPTAQTNGDCHRS